MLSYITNDPWTQSGTAATNCTPNINYTQSINYSTEKGNRLQSVVTFVWPSRRLCWTLKWSIIVQQIQSVLLQRRAGTKSSVWLTSLMLWWQVFSWQLKNLTHLVCRALRRWFIMWSSTRGPETEPSLLWPHSSAVQTSAESQFRGCSRRRRVLRVGCEGSISCAGKRSSVPESKK